MWQGRLLHIHTAPQGRAAMVPHEAALAIAGVGIEGDRYATGRGHYSEFPDIREVTLIEEETLTALVRDHALTLPVEAHRRNLTTRDVPLNHLVGRQFFVGEVLMAGGRLNTPCRYLDLVTGLAACDLLTHRSGLNARILKGGMMRRGDVMRLA